MMSSLPSHDQFPGLLALLPQIPPNIFLKLLAFDLVQTGNWATGLITGTATVLYTLFAFHFIP